MADYYPLIARAVANLPQNTKATRRALYERARTALTTQLRAQSPAFSEANVKGELQSLEEAIRKVELSVGGKPKKVSFWKSLFTAKPSPEVLIQAALKGDIDGVDAAIAARANVNAKRNDSEGWTALMAAVKGDHLDCVNALIAAGADVNAIDNRGGTALIAAAHNETAGCAKALLAAGANANARNKIGMTALATAQFLRQHAVVAALSGRTERSVWEEYHPREAFYEAMSKQLVAKHGALKQVVCISLYPDFKIEFHYADGACIRSDRRTREYDIHFMRLGYTGEGPRYAKHFLAAAGFDLTSEEIDGVRSGDCIVLSNGKAVVERRSASA